MYVIASVICQFQKNNVNLYQNAQQTLNSNLKPNNVNVCSLYKNYQMGYVVHQLNFKSMTFKKEAMSVKVDIST